jgi:hypothetical protein
VALAAVGSSSGVQAEAGRKAFAIFFYESPEGFANRTNKESGRYWAKWTGYIGSIQKSGVMESGAALLPPARVGKSSLSGYLVVRAKSLKEAEAIARRSPAVDRVEVREVLPMAQHKGAK